jgi:hypothetical protein
VGDRHGQRSAGPHLHRSWVGKTPGLHAIACST